MSGGPILKKYGDNLWIVIGIHLAAKNSGKIGKLINKRTLKQLQHFEKILTNRIL